MNKDRSIGFGTGFYKEVGYSYEKRLALYSDAGCSAVELTFVRLEYLDSELSDRMYEISKSFVFRSIHAPQTAYPSADAEKALNKIITISQQFNPSVIVFHPDEVVDFSWIDQWSKTNKLSVAFENMDFRKQFGKTIGDLEQAFTKVPDAKWVFDVNHIYSIDEDMKNVDEYYRKFKNRLSHYHLSGFGGDSKLHQCLAETHQNNIIDAVSADNIPIIIESGSATGNLDPKIELVYIKNRLK